MSRPKILEANNVSFASRGARGLGALQGFAQY